MPIDAQALARAAQGGGQPQPGMMEGAPGAMPQAPGTQGLDELQRGVMALDAFFKTQMQQGSPQAEQGRQMLIQLVQLMASMGGGMEGQPELNPQQPGQQPQEQLQPDAVVG